MIEVKVIDPETGNEMRAPEIEGGIKTVEELGMCLGMGAALWGAILGADKLVIEVEGLKSLPELKQSN